MSPEARAKIVSELMDEDVIPFKEIATRSNVSIKTVANIYKEEKAKEETKND